MKKEFFKKIGFLGLFIYITSLFFSKGGMNIGLGLMIVGAYSIDFKKNISEYDPILKWFLMVILLTPLWALFSDGGVESGMEALKKIYRFIPAFLGLFYLDSSKKIKYLLNGLSVSVVINFISGVIFYKNNDWNLAIRYSGIIKNPLDNGHVASAIFFILLGGAVYLYKIDRKSMLFNIIGVILSFIILILSQGRGAWLAFIGGVLAILLLKIDIKKIILIGIISTICFFSISKTEMYKTNRYVKRFESIGDYKKDDSSMLRIIMWDGVINTYKKNKVFGVGRDNLSKWLLNYIDTNNSSERLNRRSSDFKLKEIATAGNPHNMYMVALGEMGIMSIALFLFWVWVYIDVIRECKRKFNNNYKSILLGILGGFTSLYITGLTESSWRNIWKGNTYIVLLVIYFAIKSMNKRGEYENNNF